MNEHNPKEDVSPADSSSVSVTKQDTKKYFLRNAISNVISFVFNAATSFIMVPYQIAHLGISNYGMVGVANSFVSYTQILTVALTVTMVRFVIQRLAVSDIEGARKYFTTQFVSIIWFSAIFFPICCVVSYYTPAFINIPPGQETNTRWLFVSAYASFFLVLFANPFTVAQFTKQRFDLRNYIDIGNQVVRYSVWILLFTLMTPALWHIGAGFVCGAAFTLVSAIITFRKLIPEFGTHLRGFDWSKFRDIMKMGTWIVTTQVGFILYLSVDVLIINQVLSSAAAGKYGIILQFAIQLRALSSMMTGMITPMAIASYAKKETAALAENIARCVKFVSMGMAIAIGIICGIAVPFLSWWLGPKYAVLAPLVWLILAHQIVNCGVQPIFNINVAANKIAMPAVFTLIGGTIKLILAFILLKYTRMGIYGVAISTIIGFAVNNWVFTPIYAARTIGTSCWPFYRALLPSLIVFAMASGLGLLGAHLLDLASFVRLAIAVSAVGAVMLAFVYAVMMGKADKDFLFKLLRKDKKANA